MELTCSGNGEYLRPASPLQGRSTGLKLPRFLRFPWGLPRARFRTHKLSSASTSCKLACPSYRFVGEDWQSCPSSKACRCPRRCAGGRERRLLARSSQPLGACAGLDCLQRRPAKVLCGGRLGGGEVGAEAMAEVEAEREAGD